MGTWLTYSLPWQLWAIPSVALLVGLFIVVSRTFGIRNAIIAVVIFGAGTFIKLVDHRGRQIGWDSRVKREKEDAQRVVDRAEKARRAAAHADTERLRDDDGFRRD